MRSAPINESKPVGSFSADRLFLRIREEIRPIY